MSIPLLTNREREICCLLMLGLSCKEMANRLSLSRRTVEDHLYNAEHKFGVSSSHYLLSKLWSIPEWDGVYRLQSL